MCGSVNECGAVDGWVCTDTSDPSQPSSIAGCMYMMVEQKLDANDGTRKRMPLLLCSVNAASATEHMQWELSGLQYPSGN